MHSKMLSKVTLGIKGLNVKSKSNNGRTRFIMFRQICWTDLSYCTISWSTSSCIYVPAWVVALATGLLLREGPGFTGGVECDWPPPFFALSGSLETVSFWELLSAILLEVRVATVTFLSELGGLFSDFLREDGVLHLETPVAVWLGLVVSLRLVEDSSFLEGAWLTVTVLLGLMIDKQDTFFSFNPEKHVHVHVNY